jgi:Tfp pilus assembly protein PilF
MRPVARTTGMRVLVAIGSLCVAMACERHDRAGPRPSPTSSALLADPQVAPFPKSPTMPSPETLSAPFKSEHAEECTPLTCPTDPRAMEFLRQGRHYLRIGNLSGALRNLREAVRLAPQNVECLLSSARAAMLLQTTPLMDEARVELERAATLSPNDPRVLLERGLLELYAGEPEAALGFLEQAATLDPNRRELKVALAWATADSGDLPRADRYWSDIRATSALSGEELYLYGLFLRRVGRPEEARRYLELAAKPRKLERTGWQFRWTVAADKLLQSEYGSAPSGATDPGWRPSPAP